ISCVVFAGLLKLIDFKLENGQQIEVRGKVTIYPQNGSYQINVERIRKVGIGALWEAYHRLMDKLKSEGLFEPSYKKKIPVFPKSVGVITSSVGAVIRDVVTTLKRRMPNIPIIIYHTAVQGSDAGMQIAKAIKIANTRSEVDVLIVCRGGGSMEDLWCFNEEVVAREVFMSKIPLISAVGHETDTTIIDFVADLRAPTPTAAAELVAKSKAEWDNLLINLHHKLYNNFTYILDNSKKQLDLYIMHLKHLNPLNQLQEKHARLKNITYRIRAALERLLYQRKNRLEIVYAKLLHNKINLEEHNALLNRLYKQLNNTFSQLLASKEQKIFNVARHLELVNPRNILSRGYAIVKNKNNQIIYSSNDLKQYEKLNIILRDDEINVIVEKSSFQDKLF
ncbi:MAG: exodeoxyribonuclease large subunit, partial [Burkholderiales bacterium]|nr:exodeoxyribonuclease large subunit [Burkholderiales bacterium]